MYNLKISEITCLCQSVPLGVVETLLWACHFWGACNQEVQSDHGGSSIDPVCWRLQQSGNGRRVSRHGLQQEILRSTVAQE